MSGGLWECWAEHPRSGKRWKMQRENAEMPQKEYLLFYLKKRGEALLHGLFSVGGGGKLKVSVLFVRVAVAGYDSTDSNSESRWIINPVAGDFEKPVGVP